MQHGCRSVLMPRWRSPACATRVISLTGFALGLMAATLARVVDGSLVRKAGVMAIVITGGVVRPDDPIRVALPSQPYQPLGLF